MKKYILLILIIFKCSLAFGNAEVTLDQFLDLSDTPDSYSGQGSKVVSVKSNATGLEFTTPFSGIGSSVASGTSGSVLYIDASGNLAQDNANLFYSNAQLSIGTNSAVAKLTLSALTTTKAADITHTNTTNADTTGSNLTSTVSPGTLSSFTTREVVGASYALTPTVT
ncbi:MAG TPA: hypothetical protein VD998_03990, partial [Verrucomicrobiae bacterium]|nr:hypothetical protein [Verrucomicrobiae bacterium]